MGLHPYQLFHADGSKLLLSDIAKISDGFADVDLFQSFNGEPAILVRVLESAIKTPWRLRAQ